MNYLRNITPIALLLLLTCCSNPKSEKIQVKEYTNADLLGKWKQVIENKSITDPKIEFLNLINDSVAEIQIIDSIGRRMIFGKWENGFRKEIKSLNIQIESDIKITFRLTENNSNILILRLEEDNNRLVMSGYEIKFEKE